MKQVEQPSKKESEKGPVEQKVEKEPDGQEARFTYSETDIVKLQNAIAGMVSDTATDHLNLVLQLLIMSRDGDEELRQWIPDLFAGEMVTDTDEFRRLTNKLVSAQRSFAEIVFYNEI